MSNKLVKNQPKFQKQSKTEINNDDPTIIRILKTRLKSISEHNKSKDQFLSSIIYFAIELFLFSIYYVHIRNAQIEQAWIYPALIVSNILISVYNIGISLYQILKMNFRKVGNIVLIILHSLIILISIYALL